MKGRKASGHKTPAGMLLITHPLVWGSVALLLLNDHVLKSLYPCWMTGKLSDLAGIVLLGAMLLVALTPLADRLRFKRLFVVVATAVTLFWLGLKLLPAGNAAITRAAEAILGHPTWYVLDPSDLLALAMLAPLGLAWRACVVRAKEGAGVQLRRALPVLAAASVALVATSPTYCFGSADALYAEDGVLYAVDLGEEEGYSQQYYTKSLDAGRTWEYSEGGTLPEKWSTPKTLPVQVCSERETNLCFRTEGYDHVQVSHDGGASWETAYRVPGGREIIMERRQTMRLSGLATLWRTWDSGPNDLAIVQSWEEEVLVVAVGTEGVLSHPLPDGVWERNAIECARPTPYREALFLSALAHVMPEISLALVVGMFVGIVVRLLSLASDVSVSSIWNIIEDDWSDWPHTCMAVIYVVVLGMAIHWLFGYSAWRTTPRLLGGTDAFLILLYALATSLGVPIHPKAKLPTWADVWPVWGTAALVFLAAALPWYLWAAGVIWAHSTALIVSLAAGLATTALALWWAWRQRPSPAVS